MHSPRQNASPDVPDDFVPGHHYDTYSTNNLLHKLLVRNFLGAAKSLICMTGCTNVLEIGCGAGELAHRLFGDAPPGDGKRPDYTGIDVSREVIAVARERYPHRNFRVASAYALPFDRSTFDLVVACEVMEHLERPQDAMREIDRVGGSHILLSVPWEPIWRTLNLASGRYVTRFGNTPGHVQNFTRAAIRGLVASRFTILAERRPFPWTMILAQRS